MYLLEEKHSIKVCIHCKKETLVSVSIFTTQVSVFLCYI